MTDELTPSEEAQADLEPITAIEDFDPLALIQQSNQEKVRVLESVGVQLGPAVLGARLEAVIEALWPEGSDEARALNLAFETKLAPLLDRIAGEVRAQIAQRDAQEGAKLLSVPGART